MAMLLCGACMGVTYDALGILRQVRGLCAFTDLLFGVCCAAGIIWTALWLETDAFRLYVFVGAACGMALYGTTAGMIIRRMAAGMRRMTAKAKEMDKTEEKYKKHPSPAGN